MIYTYYQYEYESLIAEVRDDIFDNLLEKYPDLIDSVEKYTDSEIDKKKLLRIVKSKFWDDVKYSQIDMSEQDIIDFELEQKDIDYKEYKEEQYKEKNRINKNLEHPISPYVLMKRYQNGDEKALDELFQWNDIKNKVDFTTPALSYMLKKCIRTNESAGLENVKHKPFLKSTENKLNKSKGWIKRYVQPVDSEYIEGLFTQTLLEILNNKPSECPENLNIIKKYESKGIDSYDISVASNIKLIMLNNEIKSDKDIYEELKYRLSTILSQTFTRTESKTEYTEDTKIDGLDYNFDIDISYDENDGIPKNSKPKKYLLSKYECADIVATHTSDDEYNLYLSDMKVAKDYMMTQLNIGYQDVYAYILSNIKGVDFNNIECFSKKQKEYIDFFKNCEGKYFRLNENNHYVLDIDAVAINFNCSKGNVSLHIEGICSNILKYLDLDMDFEFKEAVHGNGRELIRKAHKNKQHLTFKSLYIYSLTEKINTLRCSEHYSRTDMIKLSETPVFKDLIKDELDNYDDLFFNKMFLGGYPNTIVDIFDVYCMSLNEDNIQRLKDLFYDSFGENKLLATLNEYHDLTFALICCIKCYIDEMYTGIPNDKIFNSDRYKDYGYASAGQINYKHDGYLDFEGERLDALNQVSRTAQKYIAMNERGYHIKWAYYWERNENTLFFYKWVENLPIWDESILPIRHNNKDVEIIKYDLSDNWEILYEHYLPFHTQFLIDHGRKIIYILPHKYRAYKNNKKIYHFLKAI